MGQIVQRSRTVSQVDLKLILNIDRTYDVTFQPALLRHYPYRFGLRVLRILADLEQRRNKPCGDMPAGFDPLKAYQEQGEGEDWDDAGMLSVLDYLIMNKYLKVPREWRCEFNSSG